MRETQLMMALQKLEKLRRKADFFLLDFNDKGFLRSCKLEKDRKSNNRG